MGWTAWTEQWNARRDAVEWMREVANRLRAPEMAHAFHAWSRLNTLTRRADEQKKWSGVQAEKAELEEKLERVQADASRRFQVSEDTTPPD